MLLSFRIDLFDILAVQGTLTSLHQHHSSKASVLRHSAFFMVQLSHLYLTTGKTLTIFVIAFKEQASFNFMAAVILDIRTKQNVTPNEISCCDVKNGHVSMGGEEESGTNWEIRTDTDTLACVKQIASGDLL